MNIIIIQIEKVALAETGSPSVYTLYLNGDATYVGQSVSLTARIKSHIREKEFDSFSFFNCEIDQLDEMESAEIARCRPKLNKILPKNNTFVGDRAFAKEVIQVINKKLLENNSFVGCPSVGGKEGIIYTKREYTNSLIEHIENFVYQSPELLESV